MAINVGPTLRRRRAWARLTQQELVDHTRLDRSASYLGSIETGKTSPTLHELERLARYFNLTVIELLQESSAEGERRGETEELPEEPVALDERLTRGYHALNSDERELLLDILEAIIKRRSRR